MHVFSDPFWSEKFGNSENEYEDAFWPKRPLDDSALTFRFAVADGATESSYSKFWAGLLVEAFCGGELEPKKRIESLRNLESAWSNYVTAKPIPWYLVDSVRSGAFSSILGLTLKSSPTSGKGRTWQAVAVGDSCLVQMRGDQVVSKFPISDSASFSNRPILLSSSSGANAETKWLNISGTWESDDTFFMMTDALAHWFLAEVERHQRPWDYLRGLEVEGAEFHDLVCELRRTKVLRNDDVTLLRITPN
jgi:hypothetical protein